MTFADVISQQFGTALARVQDARIIDLYESFIYPRCRVPSRCGRVNCYCVERRAAEQWEQQRQTA